jgi:hypothetical protein
MTSQRGMDFVKNKLKGTIAEIIFQHMFQDDGFATVLPFGYEQTQPMLAQYQHVIETAEALAHIRHAITRVLFWLVTAIHRDLDNVSYCIFGSTLPTVPPAKNTELLPGSSNRPTTSRSLT